MTPLIRRKGEIKINVERLIMWRMAHYVIYLVNKIIYSEPRMY